MAIRGEIIRFAYYGKQRRRCWNVEEDNKSHEFDLIIKPRVENQIRPNINLPDQNKIVCDMAKRKNFIG